MRILIFTLMIFSFLVSAQSPAARFELASIPLVSQAASRLDNAVAPRFRDSAAALTLILTSGAARFGMDLTRPAEIIFYTFGAEPSMRILAYALPGIREPQNHAVLLGVRFHARQEGNVIALDSEGVSAPFPSVSPGKNLKDGELLRGTSQSEAIQKYFQFRSFNTKDPSAHLLLRGIDELLAEMKTVSVIFSADENTLHLELTAHPLEKSALRRWMQLPLPPKGGIETFAGTQTLAILRLNPTDSLLRYGKM